MADSLYEECDYLFKAVLIGDSAVGKTNLLSRFARAEFHLDSKPTIGVEFAYRNIRVGGKLVKAQIWDTAGQERFRAITSSYYRGALGAMLVYDVTRRATFDSLGRWIIELREFDAPDIVVVLVGNKMDLGRIREVGEEEGRRIAEKEGLYFLETSALENLNVEEAFVQMISQIHEITTQKNLVERKNEEEEEEEEEAVAVAAPNVGKTLFLSDEVPMTKPKSCCSL